MGASFLLKDRPAPSGGQLSPVYDRLGEAQDQMPGIYDRLASPNVGEDAFAAVQEAEEAIPEYSYSVVGSLADVLPGNTALEGGIEGAAARAGDLVYGASRIPQTVLEGVGAGEWAQENLPDVREEYVRPALDFVFGDTEALEAEYPQATWDTVKGPWQQGNKAEALKNIPGFIAYAGPQALVDMVGFVTGPVGLAVYGAARTSEIAEGREESGGEINTPADIAIAAGTMVAVTALDRLGYGAITNNPMFKRSAESTLNKVTQGYLGRAAKGALTEAPTEFTQEYLEYVGETVRDDEYFKGLIDNADNPEALEQALIGAIVGGGVGGAMAVGSRALEGAPEVSSDGVGEDEQAAVDASDYQQQPELDLGIPETGAVGPAFVGDRQEEPPEPAPVPPEQGELDLGQPQQGELDLAPPTPTTGIPTPPEPTGGGLEIGEATAEDGEQQIVSPPSDPVQLDPDLDVAAAEDSITSENLRIRRAQAFGDRIANTGLGQFVSQAAKGRQIGSKASKVREQTAAAQLETMADNLALLTSAESRRMEQAAFDTVSNYRGSPTPGIQARRDQLQKVSEALRTQAQNYQELADDIRRTMRQESDALPPNAITGAVAQNLDVMQQLGLDIAPLIKASQENSAAQVRKAIEGLNKQMRSRIKDLEGQGVDTSLVERGIGRQQSREIDEGARKAQAFRADAERTPRYRGVSRKGSVESAYASEASEEYTDEEGTPRTRLNVPKDSPEAVERREFMRAEEAKEERRDEGFTTSYQRPGRQYEDVTDQGGNVVAEAQPVTRRAARVSDVIAELEQQRDAMPKRWVRKRKELNRQIAALQRGDDSWLDTGGEVISTTPSAEEAAAYNRTRAPGSSKKRLEAALTEARADKGKAQRAEKALKLQESRLARAEQLARGEDVQKRKAKVEQERKKEKLEALSEEEREALADKQEAESKEDRKARAAIGDTDKPVSGTIKKPSYGVSSTRLSAAKKAFAAYTKAHKKNSKIGLPPGTLKQLAAVTLKEKISSRGVGSVLVFNPEMAEENPRKAFTFIRGAYPARRGLDAKGKPTTDRSKIVRYGRAKPQKIEKDTMYTPTKNREFYLGKDVVMIRGNRVAQVVGQNRDVTDLRAHLPAMDATISPEAMDDFLNQLLKVDFPWEGEQDVVAMAQYLLGTKTARTAKGRLKPKKESTPRLDNYQPTEDPQDTPEDTPEPSPGEVTNDPDPEDIDDSGMSDDELIELLAQGLAGKGAQEQYENRRKKLVEEIETKRAEIATAKLEMDNVEQIIRTAPIQDETLDVTLHSQWPMAANEFTSIHKDGVITDDFELSEADVKPGETVDEALIQFTIGQVNEVIQAEETMLAALENKLEELDAARDQGSPGASKKKKKPRNIEGSETDQTDDGGTADDGGTRRTLDPRISGREVLDPGERRATDLFERVTKDVERFDPAIQRARAYQLSGPDGLTLSDEQVEGAGRGFQAYLDAIKSGTGGFLNIDGTGFGKSRQVSTMAQLITEEEANTGNQRPVLILTPGKAGSNEFNEELKNEMRLLGVDPNATYENGTRKFEFKHYNGLQNETGKTEYAAVISDEAHGVKGSGKVAAGFKRLNTPFRAFFTATPTDMVGQEVYYLPHMVRKKGESVDEATARVTERLGLTLNSEGEYELASYMTEETYTQRLDEYITQAASKGHIVSRTYGRKSDNFVNTVGETAVNPGEDPSKYVDGEAQALYDRIYAELEAANAKRPEAKRIDPATDPDLQKLTEHMKLPYMVARTKQQVDANRKVIAVFTFTNPVKGRSRLKGTKYATPALERYKGMLAEEHDIPAVSLSGDSKPGDRETIRSFTGDDTTDGVFPVIAISDTRGATGLNLNDKWGDSPRYMMIARTSFQGERFMQVLGRHDRRNNRTVPYTEFVRLDNPTDLHYRRLITDKIRIQEAVSGVTKARNQNETLFTEQLYEDADFLRRQRAAQFITDSMDDSVYDSVASGKGNPRAIVEMIAARADSDFLKFLAGHMLRFKAGYNGLKVQLIPESEMEEGLMGDYQLGARTIRIGERASATQTFMHELVHHFTHETLRTKPAMVRQLEELRDIIQRARPDIATRFPNAFKNGRRYMDEFVTEAFTDEQFQAELANTYIGDGKVLSLFDRFVRWVKGLLGVTFDTENAMDTIVGMGLFRSPDGLDFDTQKLHRLRAPSFIPSSTKVMQALEERQFSEGAQGTLDKMRKAMIWTMTYDQIVETFKKYTGRTLESGKPGGNIIEDMRSAMEETQAIANKRNVQYSKEVMDELRKFSRNDGKKMIKVRMRKGGEVETMTQLEYLANLMNISGYAQVHFTKDAGHRDNRMLKTSATAKAAWQIHRQQFNRKELAEARRVYTKLANFFEKQQTEKRRVLGGVYLDTIFPNEKTPWIEKTDKEIRAKLKELGAMDDEALKNLTVQRDALKEIQSALQPGIVPGAYFPLKRYGDYVIVVDGDQDYGTEAERDELLAKYPNAKDDPDNDRVVYKTVARFETRGEAARYMAQMKKDMSGNEYARVRGPMKRAEPLKALGGDTQFSALMNNFERNLSKRELDGSTEASMKSLFAQTLLDMMPETSVANAMRERKGIHGASLDILRVLNNYGASQGHLMANLQTSRKKIDLAQELDAHVYDLENRGASEAIKMRQVQEALTGRQNTAVQNMFDMGRIPQTLSDVGFLYYLVGASYNMVNATQVPLVAGPYLAARYGVNNTQKALGRAYRSAGKTPVARLLKTGGSLTELRKIFSGEDFNRENYEIMDDLIDGMSDENHKKLLRNMRDLGDIEASLAMDMARMSERPHVDENGNPIPTSVWDYLTDWMRMAPHITEIMNRSVTAVAAFDLEYAKSQDFDKAQYAARQAVKQTQFVYQNWNKPPAFQNQFGRLALMFKQHVQHMYYYMFRNMAQSIQAADPAERAVAQKALSYFVLMHVMAAGAVGGTPELIKWMLNLAYWASGEDEPFDYERRVRNLAYDLFGQPGATFASQGLPGFLGMDLSGRVGIDSMLMFEGIDLSGRDSFAEDTLSTVGGPLVGLAYRGIDARNRFKEGQYGRMAEAALPKVMRDPVRAYRYSQEGFKDLSGKTYLDAEDMDWWDFGQQMLGFSPKIASDTYQSRAVGRTRTKMMNKRNVYFTRFYNAGSPAERKKVMQDIAKWNVDNPSFGISYDQLVRSFNQRRRIEAQTYKGVYTPRGQRDWAVDQQRSY